MSTTRPTTSTDRVLPALLAAVAVSIVLGILGMHALSTRGVMSDTDHAAMTGPAPDPVTGTHADRAADPANGPAFDPAAAGDGAGAGAGHGAGEGEGHDMGAMVMLCAAMLAATAAAVLILTLGSRRAPRLWAHVPIAAPTTVSWRITSRPGTGPPPVCEFSVIRC